MVTPRRISDFKPLFTNLAQTSHFLVEFGVSHLPELTAYLNKRGVDSKFTVESAGLLVRDAVIPATSFDVTQAIDYMGVLEKFAHTRRFTEMNMEIYVDKDYKTLKFFEHWMEFIASGAHNQATVSGTEKKSEIPINRKNYITRYQYPRYYKSDRTRIVKFERDYNREIEYNFLGLFPSSMNSISVSYESSNIMTVGVTFTYDRYIPGKVLSLDESKLNDNNKLQFNSLSESFKNNSVANLSIDQITQIYQNSDKMQFSKDLKINSSNIDYTRVSSLNSNITQNYSSNFRVY